LDFWRGCGEGSVGTAFGIILLLNIFTLGTLRPLHTTIHENVSENFTFELLSIVADMIISMIASLCAVFCVALLVLL
jgi:hypothetical protein